METVRITAGRRPQVQAFLQQQGLRWDENIDTTLCLLEGDKICATGSRYRNVLKCIAVAPEYEGEGLTGVIATELIKDALAEGFLHLFLFTKPKNIEVFGGVGFYPVAQTNETAMLENRRQGIDKFVAALPGLQQGSSAAIVANCNPFTNGHRYLVESAAARCDRLHLFILSEDRSAFPAAVRMQLAQQGTADLANVLVHPTGDYLISSATFPDYFIKDQARAKQANCELDLVLFAERFAGPLGITRRFVGQEPLDPVTASYNRQMHAVLPRYGIEVVELPRCAAGGVPVSASRVRALLAEGRLEEIRPLVPDATFAYLAQQHTCKAGLPYK